MLVAGEPDAHGQRIPHRVREIEHFFITLADGTRLAARMWLPEDAERSPVPAILEYLPYRKRDLTRARDNKNHPYLAGHGYACLRVDIRGSGDSDGVLTDEYTDQELDDGVELIRWIAEQPWCNGRVGMMGISWGGFNSLLIAARRPPALKAVISISASDDRYDDNMHYMSGCLLGDHLSEATVMFAFNSLPPDPALVGERWRDMWFQRLEGSGLWLAKWLRHQRRDDYWTKGSLCEDYSAIQCPVLAMSGWADGYTNAVFRLMQNLQVPRMALIGPWGHLYGHEGSPGPAMGFLQEAVRWWDHWLKERDTNLMQQPMLRVWMQEPMPPASAYALRPGHWIGEPSWPSPNIKERRYALGARRLIEGDAEVEESAEAVRSHLSLGMFAGRWASMQALPDLPSDQRQEDGGALVYDSAPLEEPLQIFGIPSVTLDLEADKPIAQVGVRLIDVLPSGQATRVSFGVLNLNQHEDRTAPRPLTPGQRYRVTVHLHSVAQRFPKGHRLRLSLSSSYFPMSWPPPQPVTLTIHSGSVLRLPERAPLADDAQVRVLLPPEAAPARSAEPEAPPGDVWEVNRNMLKDEVVQTTVRDPGVSHLKEIDLDLLTYDEERFRCQREDFACPVGVTRTVRGLKRGDWEIKVETRTKLTSTENEFRIHARLDAFEGDERVFSRNWDERIPRDFL
jgi:putative CocE/NonD family hydrolase